ncbi:MAG: hypothetical protein ACD_41C00126G0021 [uncultured bacterium]|nr:MAG: hypothetical protein ACD_41C00126G0021 [uncultured bacterium]
MGLFSKKIKTPTPAQPVREVSDVKKPSTGSVKSVVLIQPLVTEKATATGTYLFRVAPLATKSEIRKAFQAKYGKTPRKVNVVNVMGKVKMRGRVVGKRSNWKKAVVYLAKGETVDLFQ